MCEHFPESLTSALGESYDWFGACQVSLVIRKLPANAEDRQAGSVPGLGRSAGGGHGRPLQSPCLENLMDRGACGATVHRVVESDMTEVTECSHAHNDGSSSKSIFPDLANLRSGNHTGSPLTLGFPGYFVHIQVRRSLPFITWNVLNATELPTRKRYSNK